MKGWNDQSTQKRKGNEYCPIANWFIAELSTIRLDVHCNSIFIVAENVRERWMEIKQSCEFYKADDDVNGHTMGKNCHEEEAY